AGFAGYASLNLSAFCTAIELGLQPALAHRPDGMPLYCPYALGVTVPVMLGQHLLFFGWIEAVVTGLVVLYLIAGKGGRPEDLLSRTSVNPGGSEWLPVLDKDPLAAVRVSRLSGWPPLGLAAALVLLIVLAPIGMLVRNPAWGEWSAQELKRK